MRIISLTAQNIQQLSAVHIEPDGNVVRIQGKNAAGKTTVIQSIWWALSGKKDRPAQLLKRGEKKGSIDVNLGDVRVRLRITEKTETLEVTNADGFKASSPQQLLEGLMADRSVDLGVFLNSDAKAQADALRKHTGLDTAAIDAEIATLKAEQTDLNRDAKRIEVERDAIAVPEGAPDKEASVSELLGEVQRRREANEANDRQRKAAHALVAEGKEKAAAVERIKAEIAALQERLGVCEAELCAMREAAMDAITAAKALVDLDVDGATAQIATLEATNAAARKRAERRSKALELVAAMDAREAGTQKIADASARKAALIAASPMPVDGLTLDGDAVLYYGLPLAQASAAERITVAVQLAIAMKPELRVIRITDATLMDADTLAIVEQLADEHDFQVWLEQVRERPDGPGVFIVDGEVTALDGVPLSLSPTQEAAA